MGFRKRSGGNLLGATLVFRQWTHERGVTEHEAGISSLAELLDACLSARNDLPERITLTGTDPDGREHSLTFAFASLKRER